MSHTHTQTNTYALTHAHMHTNFCLKVLLALSYFVHEVEEAEHWFLAAYLAHNICFIPHSAGIWLLIHRDGPAAMLMFTLTDSSGFEFPVDNAGSLEREVGFQPQIKSQDYNSHVCLGTIFLQNNSNFWAKQQSECICI